jgi:hypothetical protein
MGVQVLMSRIWDSLAALALAIVATSILLQLIKPYMPYLLIGGVLYLVLIGMLKHARNW